MNDCSSSQEQMFFRLYFNRITEQQYDNLILVGCMMLQTLFGCNILQCIASWVTPTLRWPSLQVSSWVTCSCRTLHRTRGTMVKVWGCDTCYTGSGSEGFFLFFFFSFFFFLLFFLSFHSQDSKSVSVWSFKGSWIHPGAMPRGLSPAVWSFWGTELFFPS